MLDLTRLRVLAAVARTGSVTEAARQLHYSQSSVSHHLARLEASTGVRLVQRAGRGIRLTHEGERLARRADEIAGRVDAAEEELAAAAGLRSGRVRVAGFQSALAVLVPDAIAALAEEHPGIELQLTDVHPRVAVDLLRAGEVDVAITHTYDDDLPDDIRTTHLLDDPMLLLTRQTGETLDDHRDSPWIAGCENCRLDLVAACTTAGFTPRIRYVSDDVAVKQALVAAGLGVTISPALAVRPYRLPGVATTKIPGYVRHIHTATYGEPPDPPATAAFLAALHARRSTSSCLVAPRGARKHPGDS